MVQKGWTICACGWWANGKFCPHCGQAKGRPSPQQAWMQAPPWQPQKGSGKGQRSGTSAAPWRSGCSGTAVAQGHPQQPAAPWQQVPADAQRAAEYTEVKAKVSALQSSLDALPSDAAHAKEEIAKLLAEAKLKLQDLMPPATQLAVAIKVQKAADARRLKAEESLTSAKTELTEATLAAEEAKARLDKVKQIVVQGTVAGRGHSDDAREAFAELVTQLGPKELIPKNIAEVLTRLDARILPVDDADTTADSDALLAASGTSFFIGDEEDEDDGDDDDMPIEQLLGKGKDPEQLKDELTTAPSTPAMAGSPAASSSTPRL